ncbi:hypothetical protein FRC02_005291 [Tulasnella sp. 418]|nr:hypothetical protein FRC02_005291 [Tulasnella sp. 418]
MSGSMMAVDQPPAPDTSVSQDPTVVALEKARATIQNQLKLDDSTRVELENTLNAASSNYTNPPNDAWQPFKTVKFVQLPKHILDEYNGEQHLNWATSIPF